MTDLLTPFSMFGQFDWPTFLAMFWFVILLEIPRYTLSGIAVFLHWALSKPRALSAAQTAYLNSLRVSVQIAGHNEADAMAKLMRSLAEQTRRIDEIVIIDDGSTDKMREIINEMRRKGLIDVALSNQLRCGKPSACNAAFMLCSGDIILNIDADCSFDRDAIEKLIEPFVDPTVGAATGSIGVRNYNASAVAAWQAIEYLQSISLGKRVIDMLDMVTCVSGAWGAFRRESIHQIGIMASGPGEDLDLTLRLRRAGWKIRFAPDAWCFTDVPVTRKAITKQRRRWDRDEIRLRIRKYRDSFNPFRRDFSSIEMLQTLEYVVLNAVVTLAFPFYVGWTFAVFGPYASLSIFALVALFYFALSSLGFAIALAMTRRYDAQMVWAVAPYLLTFTLFSGVYMRLVRFYAYLEEWIAEASRKDPYSPRRVAAVAYAKDVEY